MKKIHFFFLIILIIVGCKPLNPFEEMGGPEYFPSEEGMWWKYSVYTNISGYGYENYETLIRSVGEGTIKLFSFGDEIVTKPFYGIYLDSLGDTVYSSLAYVYISNLGVYIVDDVFWPTPILYFPLYEGLKWEETVKQVKLYYLKGECKGKENITLPAGKFSAYKIVLSYYEYVQFEEPTNLLFTRTDWYVENIGRVKRLYESGKDTFKTELIEWGKGK